MARTTARASPAGSGTPQGGAVTRTLNTKVPGRARLLLVSAERCQGHNRCKAIAPELFELDELGNAHAAGDGIVPAGRYDQARLAQANCPEFAITLLDAGAEEG